MSVVNYAFLPTPNTVKFMEWATLATEQFAAYGIPVPLSEAAWQSWAENFSNGSVPGTPGPDPYGFPDWQSWANALIGTT
jgi:hypothetical protein